MAQERDPSPSEQVKRLYEEEESRTAKAFEQLVARESFGELLARVTENAVGLTKIGTDTFDLVLRNLRLAGRQDITRLARQIARVEDKLELVLQEVERLSDLLEAGRSGRRTGAAADRRSTSPNGGRASSRSSGRRARSGTATGSGS
jgi:hypothetical protein